MKNSEYWHRRMMSLENTQYKKNIGYFEELERIYQRAILDTELDLAKWYLRFAKNNEISMAEAKRRLNTKELEEFKWSVDDYIKYGKENALNHQWMKELENASARYHISRIESLKLQMQNHIEVLMGMQEDGITDLMRNHLEDGYYQTIFELQKGFGVGTAFSRLDRRMIEKVLQKPWAADGTNFSERIWKQRDQLVSDVYNRLVQGIIRGQHPNKIVKGMAEKFNVRKSAAKNLILTESAYFRSEAQKQAYKELGVKEFEIDAALDGRTCGVCGDMDGKHMPLSNHVTGVTAPPFHPRCRCCTVPYFNDEFTVDENRAARNENNKYIVVPSSMKYLEWKEKYLDKSLISYGFDGIINTKNGIQVYSSSGHSLERAIERGVSAQSIKEALERPLHIGEIKYDSNGRASRRFIGEKATVNINPDTGVVTTVWRTGRGTRKKYEKRNKS